MYEPIMYVSACSSYFLLSGVEKLRFQQPSELAVLEACGKAAAQLAAAQAYIVQLEKERDATAKVLALMEEKNTLQQQIVQLKDREIALLRDSLAAKDAQIAAQQAEVAELKKHYKKGVGKWELFKVGLSVAGIIVAASR